MKTQQSQLNIIFIFAAAVTAIFVAGCAEMGSGNTTSLLTAAGFRARTPQTPQQQQIYAALPPYQVHRATVKGKGVFYVYKDEKAGMPTWAGSKNTNATSSWLFSSRSLKTITWRRKWTVQPHLVGTEHGVRGRSGGERRHQCQSTGTLLGVVRLGARARLREAAMISGYLESNLNL